MSPKRIQMTRQRPWRAESPDAVIVARPSKWGNPFRITRHGGWWLILLDGAGYDRARSVEAARELSVESFRLAIHPAAPKGSLPDYPFVADMERELAGRDLACWCPLDQSCHADVLLEIANGGATSVHLPDVTPGGYDRVAVLGDEREILFYPNGEVRFRHRCDRGQRGVIICAPRLQIGRGHTVVTGEPLTIVASILCDDCGTHGWVTGGQWVPA